MGGAVDTAEACDAVQELERQAEKHLMTSTKHQVLHKGDELGDNQLERGSAGTALGVQAANKMNMTQQRVLAAKIKSSTGSRGSAELSIPSTAGQLGSAGLPAQGTGTHWREAGDGPWRR